MTQQPTLTVITCAVMYFTLILFIYSFIKSCRSKVPAGRNARRRGEALGMSVMDTLEPRLMLTTFVQSAGIVTVHLDSNNEILQVSATGPGVINMRTNGAFTDGGIAPSTFNNGVFTESGVTAIVFDDSAGAFSGDTIEFLDSGTNVYAPVITINLTNAAAGAITFDGTSTFNGNATFATTAGAITVNSGAVVSLAGGSSTLQTTGGAISLAGTLNVTSSAFAVSAGNTISDSTTAAINTSGATTSTFKITAGTHDVLLNLGLNNFAGPVIVTQVGGTVRDVALRNINPGAALPTTTGLTIRNYTLKFDNSGIQLPNGFTITGNYTITSGGDITESGPINGVRGTFTLLGDNSVVLNAAAGNNLSNLVVFNTPKADNASVVTYIGSGAVSLGVSTLGLETFNITALNGNITQSGGTTQKIGSAGSTFTVGGGGTQVVLSNASNRFEGPLAVAGSATTVNIANTSTLPAFPVLPSNVTTLTINYANAPVNLPNLSTLVPALDTTTVTAQGIYQQIGASIKAFTNATFNAGNNPLILDGTSNDFNHLQVNNSGPNRVVIVDVNALDFGVGNSAIGDGTLSVQTGGAITQSNRITQTVNAGVSTFTAGTSSAITLTNGSNLLRGIVSLITLGNASLTNNTALNLGTSNIGGFLTLTPSGNALTQDPGTTLTVVGLTTISDAGGAVTLDNAGNFFPFGSIGVSAASATLRDDTAFDLAASTVTGNLTIHSAGGITQSGAVSAGTTLLDAGALVGITLTNAANNFSGAVSIISTGVDPVTITDTNAIQLGVLKLGTGTLKVTGTNISEAAGTAGGITQAAGAGNIILVSNGSVSLDNANNSWAGLIDLTTATSVNGLSLANKGDINFVGTPAISGVVTLNAGGIVNLPNAALNVTSLTDSARLTNVLQNITTSAGGFALSFFGTVAIASGVTMNTSASAAAQVAFDGNVNPAGPLTFTLGATGQINLNGGVWSQGSSALTINGGTFFNIGNGTTPATFNMISGTISMPAAPTINVFPVATFKVGGTSAAETVTVDNNAGDIVFQSGSSLSVGLGSTNDLLTKASGDTGNIVINNGARVTSYSGTAGSSPTPVLDAASGIIDRSGGSFELTVDANDLPHVFFVGTDIIVPLYTTTQLTLGQGGTVSPTGLVTGFEIDSDKFTVKVTPAVAVVTARDLNDRLIIVVRNATGPVALSVTTTRNLGDGLTLLGGIAVDGTGSASINAPTSDVNGDILVQGNLTALTVHDMTGESAYPTVIRAGGTASQSTNITGRIFSNISIDLPTVLNSLSLAQFNDLNGIDTVTTERYGTIKITGIPLTNVLGNFNVSRLTNLNMAGSPLPAVGAVTVANQLSGQWDVGGKVTSITAKSADTFSLGLAGAANVRNGNLLGDVTTLNLGIVTNSNVISIGKVSTINVTSWSTGLLQALDFGAIKTAGNTALGDFGDFSNITLLATGNAGSVALTSLTVAGNSDSVTINLPNGNSGAISVARQLSNWTFIAGGAGSSLGSVTSMTAGAINTLNLDVLSLGSMSVVGNAAANLFGDLVGGTITVESTTGATTASLGTLKVGRNLQTSTITVKNGSVTAIQVARSINDCNIFVLGSGGKIVTITGAEWIFGGTSDSLVAQSIGTMSITGAPLSPLNTAKIVGDLSRVNILLFGTGGTWPAIGTLSVAGSFTLANNGFVRADSGLTTLKVGRDVASAGGTSLMSFRSISAGTAVVRLNSATVGRWNGVDLAAVSVGSFTVTGYPVVENPTPAATQGDLTITNFDVSGPTGITSLNVAGNLGAGSNILSPGGIGTAIIQGSAAGRIDADNPSGLTGKINTLQFGQASSLTFRAVNVGTLKTVINNALGVNGGINAGRFTVSGAGPVAIGSVSIATSLSGGVVFNVPHTVTTFAVGENISGGSEIGAGYATGSQITTLTAGNLNSAVVTSNSIKSFNVVGKLVRFAGGGVILPDVINSVITTLGNVSLVGMGSVVIKGGVANSEFHVTGGNVTSFTVGGMFASDLLVGVHPPAAGNIAATTGASNWLTAPGVTFTLGSFTTTGLFDAGDVTDTETFNDSMVIAQKLGSAKISGLDSTIPVGSATISFGVGFRGASGVGPNITVNGATHTPGYFIGGFFFQNLPG